MKKQYKFGRFSWTKVRENLRQEALYMLPTFVGFVIMVLFPTIWGFAVGAIVAGFTGIIVIRHRKAPSAFATIKGTLAVIIGILIVIITWGGALLSVLAYLFHW